MKGKGAHVHPPPTGPRTQPTKQGLDCRELIKILQELVQGVTGVRCDGVLVLEQELDSARDESAARGMQMGSEGGPPFTPKRGWRRSEVCKRTNLQNLGYFLA